MMEQAQARVLLQQMLGEAADFRDGQWEAIHLAANLRRRVLVIQRTGWGKSIVYFLATKILRTAGAGPTLLISPLLALMRNQLLATERIGLRAAAIHSENIDEWQHVETALRADQVDLLMVAPERLGNAGFMQKLLPLFQGHIGLFVVDEAHCISDWGHDFRPDYRRIVRVMRLLPASVPAICTTATANNRVVQDVLTQIPNLEVVRGPLIRPSLKLFNIRLDDQAEHLAWLARYLPQLPGSGIIYTLTVQDSRRVAAWLAQQGLAARAYHADLKAAERIAAEQELLDNKLKALVATVALGMGFDKPDLGFVIHFQRPGSVVAYYQQVGRAGRAVESAFGILLSGREDDEISDYFIRTAFPPAEVMEEILRLLERSVGLTMDELGAELNQPRGVIEKALKLLEVDGAVTREKNKFQRTANAWTPDVLRAEQVTQLHRAELEEMRRYVNHPGCLMEFLACALDDPAPTACGKCMNCAGKTTRRPPPRELVQRAVEFLRADALVLKPRERWPAPVLAELQKALPQAVMCYEDSGRPKTIIPPDFRPAEGRALCIYGDAGWGGEVARGKYETGVFGDALVEAAARLIREKWKPDPPPAWVAVVPSLNHPGLASDFARRLAEKLGLPFLPVIHKRRENRPQKEMQSGALQLRNLLGAFDIAREKPSGLVQQAVWRAERLVGHVSPGVIPSSPVLLVDDVVDSGWTLTLLAVMLRQHGSGPVHPFALAKASPRGG
jgi:ATP-dependent DNA helicase RecQ